MDDTTITSRLRLRPLAITDAEQTAALITPDVSQWTATWGATVSIAEVSERIAQIQSDTQHGVCFARAIERSNDGSLIGWINARKDAPEKRLGTFGYWIGEKFHGLGYMTEVCRAFIPIVWAGLGINVLEAGAQPNNTASIAILRRLGMQYVGERDELAPSRGRIERCSWFSLSCPEV